MDNKKEKKKEKRSIQNKKNIKEGKEQKKIVKDENTTKNNKKKEKIDKNNLALFIGISILLIIFIVILFKFIKSNSGFDVVEKKGDSIDLTEKEDYDPDIFVKDYVKGHSLENKEVIYYDIPKELVNTVQESEFNKHYFDKSKNVNYSINANVFHNIDPDVLIDKYIEILNNNEYIKSSYSILQSKEKNVKILKFEYINNVKQEPNLLYTGQELYFVLETPSNDTFCLEYKLTDQKMSDELLGDIANGIDVKNNKANYFMLSQNNGILIGNLRSIDRYNCDLYNFNLKIDSSKYIEVENSNNSYNITTLRNKSSNEAITIKTSYNNLNAIKEEVHNAKESKIIVNNKVFIKYYNDIEEHYVYVSESKNTYEVIMKAKGKSKLEDFANFTIENA